MTGITYRLKRHGNELHFQFPLSIRLVLTAMAAVVLAAMIAGRAFFAFPVSLTVICVAAALYDERWIFDLRRREASKRVGLIFAGRRRTMLFSGIQELAISRFVKGSPANFPEEKVADFRRHQVTLYLRLKSGEQFTIETRPSDHALDLAETAGEIGRATGIPVVRG